MKKQFRLKLFAAIWLFLAPQPGKGFALLGPYADWMQQTNGFRFAGDIGGPMDLGEEYRWNVPLLTYGFDQSFLDYFGSNGVAAVEQAFQILNDLPPASSLNLEDYSTNLPRGNFLAEVEQVLDLKTATLRALVEQLGLAQPTRNIFVLRQWDPIFERLPSNYQWPEGIIPTNVLQRNFDPELLVPSRTVNDSTFGGDATWWPPAQGQYFDIEEYIINPLQIYYSAVADQNLFYGKYFDGLSADDAGGLRYLLHTNNVNQESLLPDVRGTAGGTNFVNAAQRPGVNKINFIRQSFDASSQQWSPVTNQYTDTYWTNGQVVQQSLERVVTRPDFLFCTGDTGAGYSASLSVLRSGTSNWQNNGGLGELGPGVIRPPVRFVFNKFGPAIATDEYLQEAYFYNSGQSRWASFDETTNSPIVYPIEGFFETNQWTVRFRMYSPDYTFEWHPAIPVQGKALLQTSTNLAAWLTLSSVTNVGAVTEWFHWKAQSTQVQRYFRVIPE